jgi:polyphenol oxidase
LSYPSVLTSRQLSGFSEIRHGFSTRIGGVSKAPFSSLNLGTMPEEDPACLRENQRLFRTALGLDEGTVIHTCTQVHGTRVVEAPVPTFMEADGIVALQPNCAVAVRTADCVPILIAAVPVSKVAAVAAVHAGWRGATQGILPKTVRHLEALGFARQDLFFAFGPAIGPERFEVGEEVIEATRTALDTPSIPATRTTNDRWHLDLRRVLTLQLEALGVRSERIESVGGCTHSEPDLFFSHRRDAGRTGRHLSVIAWIA